MTVLTAEKICMPFGHYAGVSLGEIAAKDPLYIAHMAGEGVRDTYLAEALTVLADKHRKTIEAKRAAGERPKLFTPSASAVPGPRIQQLRLF